MAPRLRSIRARTLLPQGLAVDLSDLCVSRRGGPPSGDAQRSCPRAASSEHGAVAGEIKSAKLAVFRNLLNFFANFWRALSRLYQNEFLQENMRSTAFFKLYKICILLHRCNLNFLAKNRFEKSTFYFLFEISAKRFANFATFAFF